MQRRYVWLLGIVALVCAGWTGVWFYASSYADKAIEQALAREAAQGRKWTCANREIGGFPFRFAIRCGALSFSGQGRTGAIDANLGATRAIVQVYNPKLILAEIDGPVQVKLPAGALRQVDAQWAAMRASLRLAKPIPERVSVHIEGLKGKVLSANGNSEDITAASVEFHLRPAPDVTANIGAVDVALVIKALVTALADSASGVDAPADAMIAARITRAPLLVAGPRDARLENWRQGQGTLTLQNSVISKGPLQLEASGQLKLDDEHRLEGNINTRTAGATVLMQRFSMPGGNTAGLLGGLLARRAKAAEEPRKKTFLPLPLMLRDGSVWVGPIRTKVRLLPLY